MSDNRIGTCSQCGGPVVVPTMMVYPVPYCESCGATARHPHGPTIPMQPRTNMPPHDTGTWKDQ